MAYLPPSTSQLPSYVPSKYQDIINQTNAQYPELPSSLLPAILKNESGFNPNAISSAGAQGIAQFMPGTAAGLGLGNPFDPNQAIPAAGKYLDNLYQEMKAAFPNATQQQLVTYTIAAYNAGPNAVTKYNGVPPYSETKNYIQNVLASMTDKLTPTSSSSTTSTSTIGSSLGTAAANSVNTDNQYTIDTPFGKIDYSSIVTTSQSFALNAGLVALAIAFVSGGILWLAQSDPQVQNAEKTAVVAA